MDIWQNANGNVPELEFEPPGGVQEVGEHGPYYVMNGDSLVRIPSEYICRDHNYAFSLSDYEMRDIAIDGWTNSMESSAVLQCSTLNRILKIKSIVVITDNAWRRGDEPTYTWCIRLMIRTTNPTSSTNGTTQILTDDSEPSNNNPRSSRYGFKILWPLCPKTALDAYAHWSEKTDPNSSRLLKYRKPSDSVFDWKSIPEAILMHKVGICTIRAIQSIRPVSVPAEKPRSFPLLMPKEFDPEYENDESQSPPPVEFASGVVSNSLAKRAAKCMSFTVDEFTLPIESGWEVLCEDVQLMIWNVLAEECISTPGGWKSDSYRTWLAMRRVCKASKRVVENATMNFMKHACDVLKTSFHTRCVADAIVVRNLLTPRGIVAHVLDAEMVMLEKKKMPIDVLWTTIWPYMRIRTKRSPTKPPPKPLVKKTAPVVAEEARVEPVRKSARLQEMESKGESSSSSSSTHDSECDYARITIRMRSEELPPPLPPPLLPPPPPPPPTATLSHAMQQPMEECDSWVQCTKCAEWRILPNTDGLADSLSLMDLPENWVCAMHPLGIYVCQRADPVASGEAANPFRRVTRSRVR